MVERSGDVSQQASYIPERILTTDPALPYAKPPLSKDYLCGRDAKLDLRDSVPGFACTIGESILRYRGWGLGYQHSRLDAHRHGFTAWYEANGELVGVLTLNADEDHRGADRLLRSHTPMAS